MEIAKKNNFTELIDNVYQTHCLLQLNAQKAVNMNLTMRNWLIGCYIVEFEQNGEDRAKYGSRLLEEMAKSVKMKGVKGLDFRTLRSCRTFYNTYPQIWRSVTAKLQQIDFNDFLLLSAKEIQIRQSVSAELQKSLPISIRGSLTPELQITENQENTIRGSLTRELPEEYPIPSETLLSRLSFTHFVELLRKDDPLERLFYEVETIKNNWSVRELERAINTALYLRTGLSKNKDAIIRKFNNQKPVQSMEIIRDPYITEFFGFEERVTFYHRILKSHILIDLKIGKFDHSDAGQMNVYLNYYKENEMSEDDNPPIGLILCGDKSETLAKYATSGMDNQLFVSKYLVNLPDKRVLEEFIRRELGE